MFRLFAATAIAAVLCGCAQSEPEPDPFAQLGAAIGQMLSDSMQQSIDDAYLLGASSEAFYNDHKRWPENREELEQFMVDSRNPEFSLARYKELNMEPQDDGALKYDYVVDRDGVLVSGSFTMGVDGKISSRYHSEPAVENKPPQA